jgi:hypothetical protein
MVLMMTDGPEKCAECEAGANHYEESLPLYEEHWHRLLFKRRVLRAPVLAGSGTRCARGSERPIFAPGACCSGPSNGQKGSHEVPSPCRLFGSGAKRQDGHRRGVRAAGAQLCTTRGIGAGISGT